MEHLIMAELHHDMEHLRAKIKTLIGTIWHFSPQSQTWDQGPQMSEQSLCNIRYAYQYFCTTSPRQDTSP